MKGKNIHFGDPGALDILYRVTGGETGPVRLGQAHGGPGMPGALPHAPSEGACSYLEGESTVLPGDAIDRTPAGSWVRKPRAKVILSGTDPMHS